MNIETKVIGPVLAAELLKNNTRNRLVNKKLVDRYASDMANDNWQFVGDPIRIAEDGTLLDGQHRLHAVIKSDTKHEFLVITGLEGQSQAVMDGGRSRRLHDVLKINGEKHHTILGAALVYTWAMDNDVNLAVNAANWRPSTSELLANLEAHPRLRDSCAPGSTLSSHIKIPGSVAAFRHYQFGLIDPEDRDDFWQRLIKRDFSGPEDPLAKLYMKLLEDAANNQSRLDTITKHALFVKAWNHYRDGAEVKQIVWRRGGKNREKFPVAA